MLWFVVDGCGFVVLWVCVLIWLVICITWWDSGYGLRCYYLLGECWHCGLLMVLIVMWLCSGGIGLLVAVILGSDTSGCCGGVLFTCGDILLR